MFARVFLPPDGRARGAVVLCPPLGLEAEGLVLRGFEVLAGQLESEGFAVLQFDYDGTGGSSGSDGDPKRLEAWQGSVRAAVEFMRSSGARRVSLVGLRLGATIAASVSTSCGIDSLVLWDPCESGSAYLREQATLRNVFLGTDGPGSSRRVRAPRGPAEAVETLGSVYGADTVEEMGRLSIRSCPGRLADRVLVLLRSNRQPCRSIVDRLGMAHVQFECVAGQGALLSPTPIPGQLPHSTIRTIANWLSEASTDGTTAVRLGGAPCQRITLPDGDEVLEEIIRLGPRGLFGVLTRPSTAHPTTTVVILNSGWTNHNGPGRLWVAPARALAAAGLAVLRVDLSGLGDSPARPGADSDLVYSPHAMDDVADIATALADQAPSRLVLMGLCSGGFLSLMSSLSVRASGVVALNPGFPAQMLELLAGGTRAEHGGATPGAIGPQATTRARPAAGGLGPLARTITRVNRYAHRLGGDRPWVRAIKRGARRALDVKWWVANRVLPRARPALFLRQVAGSGADTLVICGTDIGRVITRGEGRALRKLRKQSSFRLTVLPDVDHSLYTSQARRQVLPVLIEHLVSRYAAASHPSRQPPEPPGAERDEVHDSARAAAPPDGHDGAQVAAPAPLP